MISVIVYGRNDEHGLRAQRRAALSLNALAATMTYDSDEIIFVDYNSADDVQTFIEAIADTLTDQALRRLRVVRVRSAQHARLAGANSPPVVESIARNIGVRQTNPNNNWVLSTNPDVVIATDCASLSALCTSLEAGHYGSARFELPAFLWQSLSRLDPINAVASVRRHSSSLRLEESVLHYLPHVGFDAPGDFQLVPRSVLFELGGFDESMRHAWHVDANLMARLSLRFGPVRTMPGLRVYHCEHTTEVSPKHRAGRFEDSFDKFVVNVSRCEANKGKAWGGEGVAFETIDEIHSRGKMIAPMVEMTIGGVDTDRISVVYGPNTFGCVPRSNRHVLPFLIDRLLHLPRDTRFYWLGQDQEMRSLTYEMLLKLGFLGRIMFDASDDADVLIIDGPTPDTGVDVLAFWVEFGRLVAEEAARSRSCTLPRRFLALNAVNCDLEAVLLRHFDVVLAPFTTRIRLASIKPADFAMREWLPLLRTGDAGTAEGGLSPIEILAGREGHVFFGPGLVLQPGSYRAEVSVTNLEVAITPVPRDRHFVLEAVLGDIFLAQIDVDIGLEFTSSLCLNFIVPAEVVLPHTPGIQIRLWSSGAVKGSVVSVAVCLVNL